MIVFIFISLFISVRCLIPIPPSSEEPQKQLETLDHLLKDAQLKIRESQDLINCLESKNGCDIISHPTDVLLLGAKPSTQNPLYFLTTKLKDDVVFDEPRPDLPLVTKFIQHIKETSPATNADGKPKYLWLTDPPARPPLSPGDIIFGYLTLPTTKDPFEVALNNEMKFEKTGYLSVAFRSLCEQIALKQPTDLHSVLQHTELIINKMQTDGRLLWLEQPMTNFLNMAAAAASVLPADELKSYVVILQYTIQHRRDSISSYVNSIIDLADGMVKPNDGEQLFRVIKKFKDFPRGTKSGFQLCQAIVEAFERPFLNFLGTPDLRVFVESANKAIKDRYPQLLDMKLELLAKLPKKSPPVSHQLTQNNAKGKNNKMHNKPTYRSKQHKKHKHRRMDSDGSMEIIPTRRQIPVNQFYITTENIYTRRLSKENMNYYKDVSKEETGIKALLSVNANDYKDLSIEDVIAKKTKKSNNKHLQAFSDEVHDNRFRTTRNTNIRYTLKDENSGEKIFDSGDETKQKKRYNVIAPITRRSYRTETSTSRLIMRRTTQTAQSRIDKYKYFNRRTTQVRDYRRKNSQKDLWSYNIKKNITKTEVAKMSKYINEVNRTRRANRASSYSDEVAALKESLIDQLLLNADESIDTSDESSSDE